MSDESREQGVELGDLGEKLRRHEYPASREELLDAYGDETLELAKDDDTLEAILGPIGQDEFESYEDVEGAIMNMVGEDAIGRKSYSDRTPLAPGEEQPEEGPSGQDVDSEPQSF